MNQEAAYLQDAQLQGRSHAPVELAGRLLPYIERDLAQFTAFQRYAYDYIRRFLDHDVAQHTLQSQFEQVPAFGVVLISCIGRLFLFAKLDHTDFQYQFDHASVAQDGAPRDARGNGQPNLPFSIRINGAHSEFHGLGDEEWRITFFWHAHATSDPILLLEVRNPASVLHWSVFPHRLQPCRRSG